MMKLFKTMIFDFYTRKVHVMTTSDYLKTTKGGLLRKVFEDFRGWV